jgi:hypothetical protein
MFEKLFVKTSDLVFHTIAPYSVERERFLEHCCEEGFSKAGAPSDRRDGEGHLRSSVVRTASRHLAHPFQWKNTLPWHPGPAANVRILRFKNLPPFRHDLGLQNHV